MTPEIHFAIPGNIHTLTGGYGYDRRLIAELEKLGIRVVVLPLSGLFPRPDAAALQDAEARFAALPDGALIIVDGLAWGVMDEIAQHHGRRLKIIALCHHPLALESGLSETEAQALRLSEKRALDGATAVLVTSRPTAELLTRQFAIAETKITVARPGTDRLGFAPCTGNPPVLLTVATLTPRKAHDVLIDALAQIRHLPWTARFVGGSEFTPDWAAQLRNKVSASDLVERILFVNALTDLHSEYRNADIFVLPSRFEGYGMVFAEALSYGLPVVAANTGAVPDVVPLSAGQLLPPDDPDGLAAALRSLLENPALRNQLQQGAREAALQLPSWEETAGIVATLMRNMGLTEKAHIVVPDEDKHEKENDAGGFSVAWLDLREPADFSARDKKLAERALQWISADPESIPLIVDLGAGTGSTLRGLSRPGTTDLVWRLVDHDESLLREALKRHGKSELVEIFAADLQQVAALPLTSARLVSASALFDLVSRSIVDQLAGRLAQQHAGFYAALNYDGRTEWMPPHPLDGEVLEAFNRDQQRDKGMGPALGPESGSYLQQAFNKLGYDVQSADSPWLLGPRQYALMTQLIEGIAAAVAQGYGLDATALQDWKSFRLSQAATGSCRVGHCDVLALPPKEQKAKKGTEGLKNNPSVPFSLLPIGQ